MKLSYFAAIVASTAFMAIAPTASAGCGDSLTCNSGSSYGSGYSSYGSSYSSYGSGYSSGSTHSYGGTAPCPSGTTPSSDGTCLMTGSTYSSGGSTYSGSSYSSSSSYSSGSSYSSENTITSYASPSSSSSYSYSSAPLGSYSGHSSYTSSGIYSTMSDAEADRKYGSGSISGPYTDGSNTIVPFTTTTENLSNYRVPGMGSNEFLTPTKCPVSVYNPGGAQVLGCYNVSKPAPVRVHVPTYHTVRIVRPVIYVRYPVPVAVPTCGTCCNGISWSRYGNNWPRGGCGW